MDYEMNKGTITNETTRDEAEYVQAYNVAFSAVKKEKEEGEKANV